MKNKRSLRVVNAHSTNLLSAMLFPTSFVWNMMNVAGITMEVFSLTNCIHVKGEESRMFFPN